MTAYVEREVMGPPKTEVTPRARVSRAEVLMMTKLFNVLNRRVGLHGFPMVSQEQYCELEKFDLNE